MESPAITAAQLAEASKRLAQQALVIGENRIELLVLEIQEERERIFQAIWLSLGVVVFGILAGVALSVAIAVLCWPWSPIGALLILTAFYAGMAGLLYARLAQLRRDWESLPATIEELRKDRECLKKILN